MVLFHLDITDTAKKRKEKFVMKETIRRGVFETNSSSTHTLTMCKESEYDKWKDGELFFSDWNGDFISKEEYKELLKKKCSCDREDEDFEESDCYCDTEYLSYDRYWDKYGSEYETFEDNLDGIVAFGYYGYDS